MLKIQSLENALDKVNLKTIKNVFNKFKCKKDEDVEKFLNTYSIDYQNKGVARTFIIIEIFFYLFFRYYFKRFR